MRSRSLVVFVLGMACLAVQPGCALHRGGRMALRESDPACPDDGRCRPIRRGVEAMCKEVAPSEPYREFDDHFPMFHPVPTRPVYPSLEECSVCVAQETIPAPPPAALPDAPPRRTEAVPPAPMPPPLPSLAEPPGTKSVPPPPPAAPPKAASQSAPTPSWVFRPAATAPESRGVSSSAARQDLWETPSVLR